jgi:hypothetical protein
MIAIRCISGTTTRSWSILWPARSVVARFDRPVTIAARALEGLDELGADRVAGGRKDDRYLLGRFLGGEDRIGPRRDDDVDFAVYELFGELGVAVFLTLRPAIFDHDVVAVDPALVAQGLLEGFHERAPDFVRGSAQETDGRLPRPGPMQGKIARCHVAPPTTAAPRRDNPAGAETRPTV